MKRIVCLLMGLTYGIIVLSQSSFGHSPCVAAQSAQSADTLSQTARFNGVFFNEQSGLYIYLNLDEETLEIPDMSFIGKVSGYMNGRIYGVWILTKHEVKENQAVLRFTNDIGSDSQTISLTACEDGTFFYQTIDGNAVRRVEGRRLVKIPGSMPMKKKKNTHD